MLEPSTYDSATSTVIYNGSVDDVVERIRARGSGEQTPIAKENCWSGQQEPPLMDEDTAVFV